MTKTNRCLTALKLQKIKQQQKNNLTNPVYDHTGEINNDLIEEQQYKISWTLNTKSYVGGTPSRTRYKITKCNSNNS